MTLSDLAITGGFDGINVSAGSTRFTLEGSRVFENANAGLDIVDAASSGAVIRDNVFYGDASDNTGNRDQNYGVFTRGQDPTVLRNEAYHTNGRQQFGMYLENVGANVVVRDNTFHDDSDTGLVVIATSFDVSGNVARDNGRGFYFQDTTADLAGQSHGNVAYGNTTGFELQTAGEHFANEAHDNTTGFSVGGSFGLVVHDVTSWRNTTGVGISGGTLRDSRVYGNSGDGVGVVYPLPQTDLRPGSRRRRDRPGTVDAR